MGLFVAVTYTHPMADGLESPDVFQKIVRTHQVNYARKMLGNDIAIPSSIRRASNQDVQDYILVVLQERLEKTKTGFASKIAETIVQQASLYHIDPFFILSQIENESGYDTDIVGTHGEVGLLQVKPSTAKAIADDLEIEFHGRETLYEPSLNIQIGVAYLMSLRERYTQYSTAFLDAYNIGPTRLLKRVEEGKLFPCSYSNKIRSIVMHHYTEFASQKKLAAAML